MSWFEIFSIRDYTIAVLSIVLIFCFYEITRLRYKLKKTQEATLTPVVLLEIAAYQSALFLKNDKMCYAKDIRVSDLHVQLEDAFKKELTLKFDPVDLLAPGQKVQLNYEVFDREFRIAKSELEGLAARLETASFEFHMRYANIQGQGFSAVLIKDKDKISIKEIVPTVNI